MSDKRMDGSMGEYNGVIGKTPGSRHQIHKEASMERSPYYDKVRPRWCSCCSTALCGWVGGWFLALRCPQVVAECTA